MRALFRTRVLAILLLMSFAANAWAYMPDKPIDNDIPVQPPPPAVGDPDAGNGGLPAAIVTAVWNLKLRYYLFLADRLSSATKQRVGRGAAYPLPRHGR